MSNQTDSKEKVSPERKADVARENGAKSHGPVTPEGKARSCLNAVTHGLTAETLVLQNEDPAAFNQLRDQYTAQFNPQTRTETDQVSILTASFWRLQRLWRVETELLTEEMAVSAPDLADKYLGLDEPMRIALAHRMLSDRSGVLALLDRRETHLRRAWEQTRRNLEALKASREPLSRKPAASASAVQNEPAAPANRKPNQQPGGGRTTGPVSP